MRRGRTPSLSPLQRISKKKQKYRVGLASTGTNVNVYPAIVRLRAAVSNETFLAEARRALERRVRAERSQHLVQPQVLAHKGRGRVRADAADGRAGPTRAPTCSP